MSRDTAFDDKNWYAYCDNNPLKSIDSEGLQRRVIILRGSYDGMQGYVSDVIDVYKKENKVEDIMVVNSTEDALKELAKYPSDTDELIVVGLSCPHL